MEWGTPRPISTVPAATTIGSTAKTVCLRDRGRFFCITGDRFGQPEEERCKEVLTSVDHVYICAGTLTETLIVGLSRARGEAIGQLIRSLQLQVIPLTEERAKFVADVYTRWGRGHHPARLNMGDCYANALAKELGCPLLYVGEDFARTDIIPAI